jgi:hypothetical protein
MTWISAIANVVVMDGLLRTRPVGSALRYATK